MNSRSEKIFQIADLYQVIPLEVSIISSKAKVKKGVYIEQPSLNTLLD